MNRKVAISVLILVVALVSSARPGPPPGAASKGARCTHEGSRWVEGRLAHGPPLGCEVAPRAAAWLLYTPPHRETVPRAGHTFVRARPVARLLFVYGCTGWWLHPLVLRGVRVQGYVFDVTTAACW